MDSAAQHSTAQQSIAQHCTTALHNSTEQQYWGGEAPGPPFYNTVLVSTVVCSVVQCCCAVLLCSAVLYCAVLDYL